MLSELIRARPEEGAREISFEDVGEPNRRAPIDRAGSGVCRERVVRLAVGKKGAGHAIAILDAGAARDDVTVGERLQAPALVLDQGGAALVGHAA